MKRFAIHHILSREKTEASINYGRIDKEKCDHLFEKLVDIQSADEIFICGPEEMIFAVRDLLLDKKVDKKKIHFELFTTPGQTLTNGIGQTVFKKEPVSKASKVSVKLDGIIFEFDLAFDGDPILDAALKQGADLPFSCKGGVCSTCKARLLEGSVEMDTNYALEEDEVAAGYILTCQSHPRTDKVMVDFDIK
jgi:ring-1,2-phenylacetyl-CoA epoxidase subunit PaaE